MKIGNIELSDWQSHSNGLVKYKIEYTTDGKKSHSNAIVMLYIKNNIVRHVRFYQPFYFCDILYNEKNEILNMQVDFAKENVDKFLYKLNSIMVFS